MRHLINIGIHVSKLSQAYSVFKYVNKDFYSCTKNYLSYINLNIKLNFH